MPSAKNKRAQSKKHYLEKRSNILSARKEDYVQNADKKKATSRAYSKRSYSIAPDRKKAYSKRSYSIAPDRKKAYSKRSDSIAPDRKKAYSKRSYSIAPDIKKAYSIRRYSIAPDKKKATSRAYSKISYDKNHRAKSKSFLVTCPYKTDFVIYV